MRNSLKQHLPTVLGALFAVLVGFILGCSSKLPLATSEEQRHLYPALPESLHQVHSLPAVGTIDIAFSPNGGITTMITTELAAAEKTIQVQAYSFTSSEISQALISAKKRGVDVCIILDKSNVTGGDKDNPRSQKEAELLHTLAASGIPIKVDYDFQIAHSKIMVIDSRDVITGSFNFTYSAEHNNAENCILFHGNLPLAAIYQQNWQWRWEAARQYQP
jgi:phosphatidylserine/phosphatidylglycerophosphate/cardiolipin synthase-like enzyme